MVLTLGEHQVICSDGTTLISYELPITEPFCSNFFYMLRWYQIRTSVTETTIFKMSEQHAKKEDFVYSHFQSQHIFNYAIVFPSGCMLVSIQKAVTSGSKGVLLAMGKVLGWKRLVQLNKDLLKISASLSQLSCTFEWLNLVEILYKRASRGSHLLDHLWRKGGRELPYSTTCFCWFGVKNSRAKVNSVRTFTCTASN